MRQHHDSFLAEHLDSWRCLKLVQWIFNWSFANKNIKKYCRICKSCQQHKTLHHRIWRLLNNLLTSWRIWESIIMNFIIDLFDSTSVSDIFYNSIMIVVDHLFKMTHYISIQKTMIVFDLINLFLDKVVQYHEAFNDIISDRDSYLHHTFERCCAIIFWSSENLASRFILALMIKSKDRIKFLRLIFKCTATMFKIIEFIFLSWSSSSTITAFMLQHW